MKEGLMKEEEELPQETPQQTKPCPSSISLFVLASAFCSGGLELMILLLQPRVLAPTARLAYVFYVKFDGEKCN